MGKNRHSKDRMFITATEHKNEYGGKKVRKNHDYQALPFDHCALSLAPFETPVCTKEGVVFDLVNLVPFVRKHKVNPVTGEPMSPSDIIRLNMAKNSEGLWHCPVLFKVFTPHSHIVAIRTSGNVYSFEAVNELNLKIKSFKDLLSDEPFKRSDIITLQNPDDLAHAALRDISNFKYLQAMRDEAAAARSSNGESGHVRHNPTSDRVMQTLKKHQEEKRKCEDARLCSKPDSMYNDADVTDILALSPICEDVTPGSIISDQKAGSALTSSATGVHTQNIFRPPSADEIRDARFRHMRKLGKKGYVQLVTSYGNINLEIHCDWAPRTAWNFMTLCDRGYYNDTTFHRLVPGFMVQGGDPSGTGGGGESAWGMPFRDEYDSRLKHDRRGIVSMANSGVNTNGSQFFITMGATPHLDLKHSIFGRVVGGMDCLDRIEKVETNASDETPKTVIQLNKVNVFVNPIAEAEEIFKQTVESSIEKRERESIRSATSSISHHKQIIESFNTSPANPTENLKAYNDEQNSSTVSIGKYIVSDRKGEVKNSKISTSSNDDKVAAFLRSYKGEGNSDNPESEGLPLKKKKKISGGFDNW